MAGAVARASTRTRKKSARAQQDDELHGSNPPSQPSAPASTSASGAGASASASASASRSRSRNGTVDLASDADAPPVAAVASTSNKRRLLHLTFSSRDVPLRPLTSVLLLLFLLLPFSVSNLDLDLPRLCLPRPPIGLAL
ncbi:BQ2448_3576 [Microbotryum intermedium]|uniref:BQ2448_3576 protein n=1 Tax=Microbotryum intermedium TaxID=269621 RepID=A0A238FG10_9BASI|nr:BQ2448_3576 [Microbotryum intermedium]